MYYRRLENPQGPWTTDRILRDYKFCNVFRATDRVSQYLISDVQYQANLRDEDLVLRTILFRLFSKEETWRAIEESCGPVRYETFNRHHVSKVLQQRFDSGAKNYTNAFILCATDAYGHPRKHDNHLALVQHMIYESNLVDRVLCATRLKEVYDSLLAFPLIGKFMAYQLSIDLNYSTVINFDESSFVVSGPGSDRGIKKCFYDTGRMTNEQVIHFMVDNQYEMFEKYGLEFPGLWGRPLQAVDCQGLFCETDKYCREFLPHLRSGRSRIKAKFGGQRQPLKRPFLPPKWQISTADPIPVEQVDALEDLRLF